MTALPNDPTRELARLDDHTALSRYATTADPNAFEVLVLRYQAMVYATCRRTLHNASDAEDATQEAFLRLAQHAGRIRSNAAAWLHACAINASMDLLRTRGSRERAERQSRELSIAGAGSAEADTWREIEPLLDKALAALSEEDRGLIVARFLAGRSQKELAEEAGVNPGTMHRRIERALDRLRGQLQASGLAVGGSIGAALAVGGAASQAPPALTGSLVKAGLVGLARSGPRAAGGAGWLATVAATGAIGLALVAGSIAVLSGPTGPLPTPVASVAPESRPLPRPTSASSPLRMSANLIDGLPRGTMTRQGERLIYTEAPDQPRVLAADHPRAELLILDARDTRDGGRLTLRMDRTTFRNDQPIAALRGQVFEATYTIDGTRLRFEATPDQAVWPHGPIVWNGIRPAARLDPAANPATGLAPRLTGVWHQIDGLSLTLSPDDIRIGAGGWTAYRFVILEWEPASRWSRVRVICADSVNPALVGKRIRMLARQDADGVSLLMHDPASGDPDRWPEDFEPGQSRWLMSFQGGRP